MNDKIEKYILKIKKLKQYQDVDDKTLQEIAEKHFEKDELEQELEKAVGSDKEEIIEAKKRFEAYLAEFPILENEVEKNGLIRLVYLEILGLRLQKVLNQDTAQVPSKVLESLCENNKQINEQKVALGILKKEDAEETELHKILNELIRRQDEWINLPENRANYSYKCASCGEWQLIRRRIDKEKDLVIKHPFFIVGGILFNKEVWKLFDEGKITDEEVAKILDVKEKDFREWIYKLYKQEVNAYKKEQQ